MFTHANQLDPYLPYLPYLLSHTCAPVRSRSPARG
jgi:hypothetical protein